MPDTNVIQDKVLKAIEERGFTADQAKDLLKKFLSPPVPAAPQGQIDYFKLTLALCAAALCMGKQPSTLSASEIRNNAMLIAKAVFSEDGEVTASKFTNGKK
jgi:hypothetical protein